jgi:hypothetical protein
MSRGQYDVQPGFDNCPYYALYPDSTHQAEVESSRKICPKSTPLSHRNPDSSEKYSKDDHNVIAEGFVVGGLMEADAATVARSPWRGRWATGADRGCAR